MLRFLFIVFTGLVLGGCTAANPDVVLQHITFEHDTVSMIEGATLSLIPQFRPKAFEGIPVVWSTSNPDIAAVSSTGTVYALDTGKVWITIKDKNSATSGKCYIIITE